MKLLKPPIEEVEIKEEKAWIEEIKDKSRNVNFEGYSEYLETEGLTSEETGAVRDFLAEFCKKSGYLWKPSLCKYFVKLCKLGNEVLQKSAASEYFTQIVPQNYMDEHFFLLMLFRDGREFVIDPCGVPVKENDWLYLKDIIPYFGLVEHATGFHKVIYQNRRS